MNKKVDEVSDVLFRIKRGLAGYVSYLAACEMNQSFSEYTLYEPTLRILTAMGFNTKSEVSCPGYPRNANGGDVKKLDFVARKDNPPLHFAIEEKFVRTASPKISGDIEKLTKFADQYENGVGYLLIFGKKSVVSKVQIPQGFREKGISIYAEFMKTRYGCRIFQLIKNKADSATPGQA